MFLSRETQSGNQKTKSQMFVTMGDGGNKSTEKIWEENGFFNDQKIDLTIPKVNFPENTLCYVNQGTVSQIEPDVTVSVCGVAQGLFLRCDVQPLYHHQAVFSCHFSFFLFCFLFLLQFCCRFLTAAVFRRRS